MRKRYSRTKRTSKNREGKNTTTETKGIEIKNQGLLIFGIILLLIGLGASFYRETYYGYTIGQPYLGVGIVLVLAGIIFVALGFFYSPRKQEPTKQV